MQTVAEDVRAPHPGRAHRHARRTAARCGSDDRQRILITGLSTYWGGRLAQALERDPDVEAIIGVGTDDPTLRARAHRVRPRRHPARAAAPDRAGGRDRHGDRHAAGRRLAARRSPRVAHETNVIGTMNILAACGGPDSPVRKVVFKSSAHYYGCERDDPAFFTEAMQRPHPPRTRAGVGHRRGREGRRGLRRAQPGRHGHACCASPTRSGPDLRTSHTRAALAARDPVHPRLRPALPVHPRGRPRRRARSTRSRTTCPASTTPPATACSRCPRSLAARPAARADAAAVGDRARRRRRCGRAGVRIPDEVLQQLRYGRGLDNRKLKAAGLPLRLHDPRDGAQASPRTLRVRAAARRAAAAPYRYEREVEEFLRWSPSVRAAARCTCGVTRQRSLQGFSSFRRTPTIRSPDATVA